MLEGFESDSIQVDGFDESISTTEVFAGVYANNDVSVKEVKEWINEFDGYPTRKCVERVYNRKLNRYLTPTMVMIGTLGFVGFFSLPLLLVYFIYLQIWRCIMYKNTKEEVVVTKEMIGD
ncbi:MAG: hypothetical protein ACOC80_16720 [Petrotogales bacterium]